MRFGSGNRRFGRFEPPRTDRFANVLLPAAMHFSVPDSQTYQAPSSNSGFADLVGPQGAAGAMTRAATPLDRRRSMRDPSAE